MFQAFEQVGVRTGQNTPLDRLALVFELAGIGVLNDAVRHRARAEYRRERRRRGGAHSSRGLYDAVRRVADCGGLLGCESRDGNLEAEVASALVRIDDRTARKHSPVLGYLRQF